MLKRMIAFLCLPLLLLPVHAEAEAPVRLPVVMYHHVSHNPASWNDYVVSEQELAADLDWLASRGYETVSIRELLDWYDGKFTMPEKPCMITFDDGFESTAAYAEPLLAQHGFCGAVAVIGSVCERFSELDEHDAELSNLSWEDAKAMAERGVIEVQCHTWDMHSLWPRNGCKRKTQENITAYRYALSADLARFLTACEQRDVPLAPAIAYPFGAYCADTGDAVRDMGFRVAFTCTEKINILTGDSEELYDLGRYNRPHGVSSEKFFSGWEENA